ncbi:hypothetical protein M885DRAFT_507527 [Pelagophyceae sp. CCMP2097]|nr:hypothetical protein M885DRAFT_507527 [Pelagophyceae sp. CCMP2097]
MTQHCVPSRQVVRLSFRSGVDRDVTREWGGFRVGTRACLIHEYLGGGLRLRLEEEAREEGRDVRRLDAGVVEEARHVDRVAVVLHRVEFHLILLDRGASPGCQQERVVQLLGRLGVVPEERCRGVGDLVKCHVLVLKCHVLVLQDHVAVVRLVLVLVANVVKVLDGVGVDVHRDARGVRVERVVQMVLLKIVVPEAESRLHALFDLRLVRRRRKVRAPLRRGADFAQRQRRRQRQRRQRRALVLLADFA